MSEKPDISADLHFETIERYSYIYKVGAGELGVPGTVKQHRRRISPELLPPISLPCPVDTHNGIVCRTSSRNLFAAESVLAELLRPIS